jgi:hypothetical protein
MTEYRLHRDAESLGSFAGDGQLLAEAAAKGRAPRPYVATHASELGADCGDLASVVRSTTPTANTAGARSKLLALSIETTALLERLEHAANDQREAARIAGRLSAIGEQATKLEEQG